MRGRRQRKWRRVCRESELQKGRRRTSFSSRPRCIFARARPSQPLVLLDWDDTILPTTDLAEAEKAGASLPEEELRRYGDLVAETLRKLQHGRVVVVTNATDGWIDATCAKHLPQVLPFLKQFEVVSARATFEPLGYGQKEWKRQMFAQQLRQHIDQGGERSVLSIGDASFEREAIIRVAPAFDCVAKSVKLLEKPVLAMLHAQHAMLQPQLEELVTSSSPCDLGVAPLPPLDVE